MRVLLDTTYAVRARYSGTAIYLERLQDALHGLSDVEVIARANPHRRPPAGGGLGSARNLLADQWWTTVALPRLARRLGAEVVHHPLPALSPFGAPAQVITVHDLAFERLRERFDRRFGPYARRAHRAAAHGARIVVCVSETTAADVRELWRVPAERIVVARHGPGQALGTLRAERPRHFLYVGDDEPRKDLPTLLVAYEHYRKQARDPLGLVLAGSARGEGPGVRIERQPGAARLAELYRAAVALVHPSLYEGFGLTLLEAMSAGVPVIAARSRGAVEVCEQAARYSEPGEASSLAEAMTELATRPALGEQLAELGRRRVKLFSWDASARAHRAAYSLALGR